MSFPLQEWDWVALSGYMTPMGLKTLLCNSSQESYDSFRRMRPKIVCTMFDSLQNYLVSVKYDETNRQEFWETGWIATQGYIPVPVDPNVITNERFFANKKEWNIVSVKMMRYYWDDMSHGLNDYCKEKIRVVGSQLISLLPGKKSCCQSCRWTMPSAEMWDDVKCTYCRERDMYPYATLGVLKQTPHIFHNENSHRKEECDLIRGICNVKI